MPKRISQVQNEKILLLNKIELIGNKEFYVDERTFQIKSIKDSSCLSIFVPQIKICEVA